jgi:hypothetical protein
MDTKAAAAALDELLSASAKGLTPADDHDHGCVDPLVVRDAKAKAVAEQFVLLDARAGIFHHVYPSNHHNPEGGVETACARYRTATAPKGGGVCALLAPCLSTVLARPSALFNIADGTSTTNSDAAGFGQAVNRSKEDGIGVEQSVCW